VSRRVLVPRVKHRAIPYPDRQFQRIEPLFDCAQLPLGVLAERVLAGYRHCYEHGQRRMQQKARALTRGMKVGIRIKKLTVSR